MTSIGTAARPVGRLGSPLRAAPAARRAGVAALGEPSAAASGLSPLSDWQIRLEMLVRTSDVEFWRSVGNGADEKLINRIGFSLEIAADGSVSKCTPLSAEQELLPEFATCDEMKKAVYVAAPEAKRHLHIVTVSYFRRRTPSAKVS